MMFKKKLLASVMATALVSGVMVSGGAQAVRLSETGAGNVLLGGLYLAGQAGYDTTRVKVVNPSMTDAIKAKVVLRSKKHSDECRDFILYLTPGDVAYFEISNKIRDGSGKVTGTVANVVDAQVWSDDDSLLSFRSTDVLKTTFGSLPGAAFAQMTATGPGTTTGLAEPATGAADLGTKDTCQVGHIEVIGLYAARGVVGNTGISGTGGSVTIANQMSKFFLLPVFDAPRNVNAVSNALSVPSGDVTGNIGATASYSSRVQLSGTVDIINSTNGDRISYEMAALRDGVNPTTAGVATPVVSNAAFDATASATTPLGQGFAVFGTNNTLDIEGALTLSTLNGLYENKDSVGTNMQVTFPTKYLHRTTAKGTLPVLYSAPFNTDGSVGYAILSLDNQENSKSAPATTICFVSPCAVPTISPRFLPDEVNYIVAPTLDYLSGWYQLTLTGVTNLPVPAVGSTHRYSVASGSLNNSMFQMMARPYTNP